MNISRIVKYISFLLVTTLFLSGCMSKAAINKQNERFTVVASFYPVYAIANYIMQNSTGTELINLTNGNQGICMHDYSLLPSDMAIIEDSDVFLTCGDDIIANFEVKNKVDIAVGSGEHPWMNFEDSIKLAKLIAETLAEKDWRNKTTYLENANNFAEEARGRQSIMSGKINALEKKHVISLDESLSSFASSIGLSVIAAVTSYGHENNLANIPDILNGAQQYDANILLVLENNNNSPMLNILTQEAFAKNGEEFKTIKLSAILSGDNTANDYFNQIDNNFERIYRELTE